MESNRIALPVSVPAREKVRRGSAEAPNGGYDSESRDAIPTERGSFVFL